MNGIAGLADMPGQMIACGDAQDDGSAALVTEFHGAGSWGSCSKLTGFPKTLQEIA
jgi:hypothetical protein